MDVFAMESLNLSHLYYFWTVVNEGTIARAAEILLLTPPTISTQIRHLERSLGAKLFSKSGRLLKLTDTGRTVYQYADEIFVIGRELMDAVKGRSVTGVKRIVVGVVNALPKLITYRLLEPALKLPEKVKLIIRHDTFEVLLRELAVHAIDVILSDTPLTSVSKMRAFNHLLGESPLSIMGTQTLAKAYRPQFPASLEGAPFLLPSRQNSARRELDRWLESHGLRPEIRGEIDDSALLKVFGQSGEGLFAVPTVIEQDVCRQYDVETVGRIEGIREQFFAIAGDRKLKNPAVVAISNAARHQLFDLSKPEFSEG
jgi:LysR family transcriptional activator of nhaA